MTRKTLTGLLLAATTLTAGTLTVVNAQDGAPNAQQQAEIEAAIAAALGQAEEKHDHDHNPTTVHSGEKAFELDDEAAYPDPDGFASMFDRISYAIGRGDATRLPGAQDGLNTKTLGEGIEKGLAEENKDYALGYSQGFELARQFLEQRSEEIDIDAFVQGIAAAMKEEDGDRSIGYLIGNSFREAEIDLKADNYIKGIEETLAAAKAPAPAEGEDKPEPPKTQLTQEQVQETLSAFQAYMMEKQKQQAIKEGTDYIDSLKAEDGWKKTESGIAYRVVEEGKGDSPDYNDIATMDYELKLLDGDKPGSVLQTTFDTPQTVPFSAEQVIKGWGEVLKLMNPGATFETVIPYDLGYGDQGSPPNIPPYATLIFKMKMHSFEVEENKPEPKPKPAPAPKPAE
ncbi:MAG: FKBP-type peptidyl-prolyl cis-trans isomerase [Phycisphaeraceae bacterium]|nr:FKBP-type peptidyl-prolyl cis-trans isomerase [Phycisphaeraceae bacterium]